MEYNNYEAAINALLLENQGVLPDLSIYVHVALATVPASTPVCMTVAELLALALVELSAEEVAAEPVEAEPVLSEVLVAVAPKAKIPAELLCYSGPVVLAELVEWAAESVN